MNKTNPTIGVFDSGFGGLTVLRALLPLIPGAHYIYLGDTARLPYGSKSRETITRYALSSSRFLADQGADLLVIACNTATALSLPDIQHSLPIPVIGVIQPGAQSAKNQSTITPKSSDPTSKQSTNKEEKSVILSGADRALAGNVSDSSNKVKSVILSEGGASAAVVEGPAVAPIHLQSLQSGPNPHVLVLATAATIQSHAYLAALNALGLPATEKACPLLVPLVEEGWIDHPVTAEVLRIYLLEALAEAPTASTLLLGCTHYPLLKPLIATTLPTLHHPMRIIDSAEATARAVAAHLPITASTEAPTCTFYATDSIQKFQRLGTNFLGQPLKEVTLLDLGG